MNAFVPGAWQDVPGDAYYAYRHGIIEQVTEPIPAPTSAALGLIGLGSLAAMRRKRA